MEEMERPESALARGVQITEYKESKVNPDPVLMEDSDILMEEYLSPVKLVSCLHEQLVECLKRSLFFSNMSIYFVIKDKVS